MAKKKLTAKKVAKKKSVPAPKRAKRTPKVRIHRVNAVYTPKGQPRCPRCLSLPSLKLREEYALSKRGYNVTVTGETIKAPKGSAVPEIAIFSLKYPCSNPECHSEITTKFTVTTGLRLPPFRTEMSREVLARLERGKTDKDGIWRATEPAHEAPPPTRAAKRQANDEPDRSPTGPSRRVAKRERAKPADQKLVRVGHRDKSTRTAPSNNRRRKPKQ